MIAFEISINGKKFVLAGFEDWNLLHAHLNAHRAQKTGEIDEFEITVGGLAQPKDPEILEHVRWGRCNINLGDEVTLRLVEVPSADKPIKRYRSDRTVQENPFTEDEIREMQFQDYLRLKEIFEGKGAANKALNRRPDGAG